jgi:Domain of unknown function DUF11
VLPGADPDHDTIYLEFHAFSPDVLVYVTKSTDGGSTFGAAIPVEQGTNATDSTCTPFLAASSSTKTMATSMPCGYPVTMLPTGDVTVADILPEGVTFVSATPSAGSCSGTSTVTCNLGIFPSGASATINIVVAAPNVAGTITNTASVAAATTDPDSSNNTATAVTTVGGSLVPTSVVSRKIHGTLAAPPAGPGDLVLNSGTPVTVEPRFGGTPSGDHTLVFSFANALNAVSSVTATATTSIGSQNIPAQNITKTVSGNLCTVDLTGIPNASHLGVILHGVTDIANNGPADITQNMDVLAGDVNGNGFVTNADVSLVKAQVAAGGTVTQSNIVNDVNVNGVITNAESVS